MTENDLFVVTISGDGIEVIGAYQTELEALRRAHDYYFPDAQVALVTPTQWPENREQWKNAYDRYMEERD